MSGCCEPAREMRSIGKWLRCFGTCRSDVVFDIVDYLSTFVSTTEISGSCCIAGGKSISLEAVDETVDRLWLAIDEVGVSVLSSGI